MVATHFHYPYRTAGSAYAPQRSLRCLIDVALTPNVCVSGAYRERDRKSPTFKAPPEVGGGWLELEGLRATATLNVTPVQHP